MPNGQPSPLPHNPRAAGFIPHRTHRPTTFSPARGTIQQHICSEFSPYRHAQPHHRGTPSIPPQGYFWLQPGLSEHCTWHPQCGRARTLTVPLEVTLAH